MCDGCNYGDHVEVKPRSEKHVEQDKSAGHNYADYSCNYACDLILSMKTRLEIECKQNIAVDANS